MSSTRRTMIKGGLAFCAAGLVTPLWAQQTQQPEPIVYVCPMHPDVQAKLPGKCPKCNMKLVAQSAAATGSDDFYLCPMHPEVTDNKAGTCPKCNMKLVKTAPPETADYFVKIETTPKAPRAGANVRLRFSIFHPVTEKQVKEFNILHDMPFHLFVVSQDFEEFQHIHPEQQADGSFAIETKLPRAGYYKLFCDFFPKGGTPQVTHHHLITAGYRGDLLSATNRLIPDKTLIKTVDGTRFELRFEPEQPFAGREAELKYTLVDEKTGQPVSDLQPYLGAWGHTLILSEDATDYLHSHPTEMVPEEADRSTLVGSDKVTFETFFPRPGNYRIWSQFQRSGRLITVSFTVAVPRLR
jgi:ssDNA-binding Zn-finger/Zn-ribbon topoisomerase 1